MMIVSLYVISVQQENPSPLNLLFASELFQAFDGSGCHPLHLC